MKFSDVVKLLFLSSLFFMPTTALAVTSAGEISFITGDGLAEASTPEGNLRKLGKGAAVYSGDSISTGKDTTLDILFADGSRFVVGSQAKFVVEKFAYKHAAEGDAFYSRIIKGAFRFVSGQIAKSQGRGMKVSVSVATIGIRGTHVEGEVSERQEKDGVSVDASAKVVLLEPEEEGKKTSIIVSNEFGSVVIDQPGYGTEIPDEKSPPSPVRKMQLRTIDNVLRALRSTVRQGGTPKPRMP